MLIDERIQVYDLSEEERAALSIILHRIHERHTDRRKPEVDVSATIKQALIYAAICRGSGLAQLDQMYTNVMQSLAVYHKEYRC